MYRNPPDTGMPFVEVKFFAPITNVGPMHGGKATKIFLNANKRARDEARNFAEVAAKIEEGKEISIDDGQVLR